MLVCKQGEHRVQGAAGLLTRSLVAARHTELQLPPAHLDGYTGAEQRPDRWWSTGDCGCHATARWCRSAGGGRRTALAHTTTSIVGRATAGFCVTGSALAVSGGPAPRAGGKDSTVLAHMMTALNARHGYGLDLFLLSIDEGIAGYRDDSLETVKRNEAQYGLPLTVLSYKQLYGWSMDEIVRAIGPRNNCTFCGVFRRQALDRGAALMRADKLATGAGSLLVFDTAGEVIHGSAAQQTPRKLTE